MEEEVEAMQIAISRLEEELSASEEKLQELEGLFR
jgi:hypothetical protein